MNRFLLRSIPALACVAFAFGSQSARADLQISYSGVSPAGSLSVNVGTPSVSGTYSAGGMNFTVSGGSDASRFTTPFVAFCAEIDSGIGSGVKTYNVVSPSSLTQVVNKAAVVDRLQELFGKHYASVAGSGANAAAFQAAVWEIVYDSTLSITSGNFQVVGGNATAATWLAGLTGSKTEWNANFASKGLELVAVQSSQSGTQDQITVAKVVAPNAVPAPAGLVLGLIGFAGLIGRNRMTRKG